MYLAILQDSRLYEFQLQIDGELASATRGGGCAHCGAALHSACYLRKPRGLPAGIDPGPAYRLRFSYCCSADGCRRRHTPPSVRFLGPKVYLSVMVLLLTAMRQGPTPRSSRELGALFGVDRRTLGRWRRWWQALFPQTAFWQVARARFMPSVLESLLPYSLAERFRGSTLIERVLLALKFIAPSRGASD